MEWNSALGTLQASQSEGFSGEDPGQNKTVGCMKFSQMPGGTAAHAGLYPAVPCAKLTPDAQSENSGRKLWRN